MKLREWERSLTWLVGPDGWIGAEDDVSRRAREALHELGQRRWIGHQFEAEPDERGLLVKPDAAYRAAGLRDAALRLAAARGLMLHAGRGASSVDQLAQAIVPMVMESPTGLRARSAEAASGSYQPTDFARSEAAGVFFESVVKPKLDELDKEFGTSLALQATQAYNNSSAASIEHWGRLWTLATALIPLSWAKARGCREAGDVARALWCGRDTLGRVLPAFYVRAGTLPTSGLLPGGRQRLQVHAELRLTPTVAQLVEGRAEWWDLPPHVWCAIHVPLKAIDYVATMVGATQQVHYRGRSVFHLYLAVFADALLGGEADREVCIAPPAQLVRPRPAPPQAAIAPAHERAIRRLDAARHPPVAAPRKGKFRTAVPALRPAARLGDALGSRPLAFDASHLRFEAAVAPSRSRWQAIGTIDPWPQFDPTIDGIDWLFVARWGRDRVVLPILVEPVAQGEACASDERLRLVYVGGAGSSRPSLGQLRQAFARAGTPAVLCEAVGCWVFAVVELHG